MKRYVRVPDPADLESWMQRNGWHLESRGVAGALLSFPETGATVGVPVSFGADHVLFAGTVRRIADATRQKISSVERDLVFANMLAVLTVPEGVAERPSRNGPQGNATDRIDFRITEDEWSDYVSLSALNETLRNARRLLSSAGTSLSEPTRAINRAYERKAQRLSGRARVGHSEAGSFIVPIFVDHTESPAHLFEDDENLTLEPYERQVTRTLARALSTASDLAKANESKPVSDEALDSATAIGVSREIFLSMDQLLRGQGSYDVDISFSWATQGALKADGLPRSVALYSYLRPTYHELASRLTRPSTLPTNRYAGVILEIGHHPEHLSRHIVIDTYIDGRRSALRILVDENQHSLAIAWYEKQATVVVRGFVSVAPGIAEMQKPTRLDGYVTDTLPGL